MHTSLIIALAALATTANAEDYGHLNNTRALRQQLNNGVGKTPAMGWNSWNTGGCNAATADFALSTANYFQSLGLQDLGYTYVNIDDCWSLPDVDSNGNLVPDPIKWPQGIKAVVDQIHAKGLKFGLYGCAGTKTCSNFAGSHDHESQHALQLSNWGVDYWKYDNCNTPGGGDTRTWYKVMRDALLAQSHKILFSLCQWGQDSVWTWGADYGNSWRIGGDIENDAWNSINRIGSSAANIAQYAAPYGFNDLDMLQIGNGKMNDAEGRTHFGLWAIAKSPLIIGTDLSKISASALSTIKNKCVIDINQDSLGKAAGYFKPSGADNWTNNQLYPYWAGPLSDGVVIGLINTGSAQQTLSVDFKDVPGLAAGSYSWSECWSGKSGKSSSVSFTLASHDMAVVKVVTGSSPVTSTPTPSPSTTTTTAPTPTTTQPTPTTTQPTPTTTQPTPTTSQPTPTTTKPAGGAKRWEQCGGLNYSGVTTCAEGTCTKLNDWYWQCV